MIVLRPRPPNNPFSRGVAIGCVVPAVAAWNTLSGFAAADLSATAETGAPNTVNGAPDMPIMPLARPQSHQPAKPGSPDGSVAATGGATPGLVPGNIGR